jgi:hypothetical protein
MLKVNTIQRFSYKTLPLLNSYTIIINLEDFFYLSAVM